MRDVTVGEVAEAVVTINFFYEEGEGGKYIADRPRRRRPQRDEPQEPARAAAARLQERADLRRAHPGLRLRRRREG